MQTRTNNPIPTQTLPLKGRACNMPPGMLLPLNSQYMRCLTQLARRSSFPFKGKAGMGMGYQMSEVSVVG